MAVVQVVEAVAFLPFDWVFVHFVDLFAVAVVVVVVDLDFVLSFASNYYLLAIIVVFDFYFLNYLYLFRLLINFIIMQLA
jgi:hypothetical protein